MTSNHPKKNKLGVAWQVVLYFFDGIVDAGIDNFIIVKKNFSLFFGVVLSIVGLMNFHSDKYCDGNVADYLSCTRPTTYYFYNAFDVFLVVLGVAFIIIWALKAKAHKR